MGILANHVWSVAGDNNRQDINATFLQPFLAFTTKTYTSFSVNTESTYDWTTEQWSVPLNFAVTQLFKIGPQIMSLPLGARYWIKVSGTFSGGAREKVPDTFSLFLFPSALWIWGRTQSPSPATSRYPIHTSAGNEYTMRAP